MTTSMNAATAQGGVFSVIAERSVYVALAIVFIWFGAMKFTAYEAEAIKGLIANSPFMAVLLDIVPLQTASYMIGTTEIIVAVLLLARFFAPALAVVGAAGAVITFLITLTFFFTTPGVFLDDVGGLAISVLPGQFLLKDLALLAASLWALSESLKASRG